MIFSMAVDGPSMPVMLHTMPRQGTHQHQIFANCIHEVPPMMGASLRGGQHLARKHANKSTKVSQTRRG